MYDFYYLIKDICSKKMSEEKVKESKDEKKIDEPTQAEKQLKEDTEKAKNEMLEQLKDFKQEDIDFELQAEQEEGDPRVKKFTVSEPDKTAGHVKYKVTGVDKDGEFTSQRRFREFDALS